MKKAKANKVHGGNAMGTHIDTMTNTIKVAAYIRVSTDEQAEKGFSLQIQRERIAAQIAAKGWELYEVYEDGGQSGGKLDRPRLNDMLADIKAGKIQAVVVYKLDRLSRSQRDILKLIEDDFMGNDVELVSVMESLDTSTPMGMAMIGIMGVFAQLERDTIRDRTSTGRKAKAKTGGYSGGGVPLGYATERDSKVIHLDIGKVDTVKRLFALHSHGYKLQEIADRLNAEGHTTKQGKKFQPMQVSRILNRRELYEGQYTYSNGEIKADGLHAAII